MNLGFQNEIFNKHERIIRYVLVGALNSAFGYFVFSSFLFFGLHYTLATLLGTIIGVVFNFFTTGKLVFRSMDKKHIFGFTLVYVILFFLNIILLKVLITCGMSAYLGGLVLIPVMALIGYLLQSRFTFNNVDQL